MMPIWPGEGPAAIPAPFPRSGRGICWHEPRVADVDADEPA